MIKGTKAVVTNAAAPTDKAAKILMIVFGVIGCGCWGPKLIRNLLAGDGAAVKTACDRRPDRRAEIAAVWPSLRTTAEAADLWRDPEIDAIAIATPASTHAALAREALLAGKHILVEKPLALTAHETAALLSLAAEQRRVMLVDHTFIFSEPVRRLRELVRHDGLGEIAAYEAERYSRGFQAPDVNVLWDLAVHDLSILQFLFGWEPRRVAAVAHRVLPQGEPSEATLSVEFAAGQRAEIRVGWRPEEKKRCTRLIGAQATVRYDDLDPAGSLAIIPGPPGTETTAAQRRISPVDRAEPLRRVVDHLLECINGRATPLAGGPEAWRISRILEAAERSLRLSGRPVAIEAAAIPEN